MSRIPKWKNEKTKVKVVFRLQFHATHIPQTGWDKLLVSFIPHETGKPIAKTNKANVRNGSCKWSDPIYETTRLLLDTRTKQYDEKLYKLVVAMGSSRSSLLGEVDINLADFVDALKPSSVALPLDSCDYGTVLHVTVQLLTSKTGFREFEQQRELTVKGLQMMSNQRSHNSDIVAHSTEIPGEHIDKVNARVRFKENFMEFPSVKELADSNEDYEDPAAGADGSSYTSDSLYTEKNDVSVPHEIDSFKSTIPSNISGYPLSQSPKSDKEDYLNRGWSSDYSGDHDLTIAYEENNRLRSRLEVAESAFLQLKSEAKSLQRVTDELSAETQGLAQQLVVELSSGEELMREVVMLKSECSRFKKDLEELKSAEVLQRSHDMHSQGIEWLQGLLLVESKVQEIQKKACFGFHGNDFDFLRADFRIVESILNNLKKGINNQGQGLEGLVGVKKAGSACMMEEKMCELLEKLEQSKTENEAVMKKMSQMERYYEAFIQQLEESQKQTLKELEDLRNAHASSLYTVSLLQEQIAKEHQEMDVHLMRLAEEKKILESQNKELEKRAAVSETALKRVRQNYSIAVNRLQKDLELLSFQVLSMYETNETLAKQAFSDSYQNYPHDNLEENILIKTDPGLSQLQNGLSDNFVDKMNSKIYLLGDPKSKELYCKDEACVNEIDSTYSVWVASQHGRELIKNLGLSADLPPETEKHEVLERSIDSSESDKRQINHGNDTEDVRTSFNRLKELYSSLEAEFSDLHAVNIQQEVFSDILLQTLHTLNDGIKCTRDKIVDLEQQLDQSNYVRESLVFKLDGALDQCKKMEENEAKYISKCDDLTLKNQILEAKLEDFLVENTCLSDKFAEYEKLMMECRAYERQCKSWSEERNRFENLLVQESLQKNRLTEEFTALKENFVKLSSENDDLQKGITALQVGLRDLCCNMISCNKQIDSCPFNYAHIQHQLENKNYMATLTCLEQFNLQACQKIIQLNQEKKEMEEVKETLESSLKKTQLDMCNMKEKFESDVEAMTTKLDISSKLVEKLQVEFQVVTEKFKLGSETEEKLAIKNMELSSWLEMLEIDLQRFTDERQNLLEKLQVFDALNEELERTKTSLIECKQENQTLIMSLQSRDEASIQMENELQSIKENMRSTHEDLQEENALREGLESVISNLSSQMKEKDQYMLSFNEQKAELVYLREKVQDLEEANSGMQDLLLHDEENQRILEGENLSLRLQIVDVANNLVAFDEEFLVGDIEVIYLRSQLKELVGLVKSLGEDLEVLDQKHKDTMTVLKLHMSNEKELVDRNAGLSTALQSLKCKYEKVVHENEGLVDSINSNHAIVQANSSREQQYEDEIVRLNDMKATLEEQVDHLISSRYELEIANLLFRSKLGEQQIKMSVLLECNNELMKLREQNNELTHKLSEQTLKTEEFKNLSIHLRELKDKADAEHHQQIREKKDVEESLRIAFIKEQYETKIQELKNQLYVSKRYTEEMLLKLQNALDEVETGKKNEISLAKRIEELSMKISEMEPELHMVLTDRKELVKAYDNIKSELECSILNLKCCQEEKVKLEASLQECQEERKRNKVELELVKRLLENIAATGNEQSQENHDSGASGVTSMGQILEDVNSGFNSVCEEMPNISSSNSGRDQGITALANPLDNVHGNYTPNAIPPSSSSGDSKDAEQDSLKEFTYMSSSSTAQASENAEIENKRNTTLENTTKDSVAKEHFRDQQRLKTQMNLLEKELEKLKNENLSPLLPLEDRIDNPSLYGMQRSISQLDMANEHLGSIFPLFKELPGSGSAWERVLALELELAEALQAKKKANIRFQSSFLKQHNDEEAVLQSFRDINELIQEMFDSKKRYIAIESELKEMQGRYSQLSLQFAEVEGERQKLMMVLKNRSPKKQ
ncbi:intracellular protein transport protein USO1 [Ananas comosus]|uniref:Intracellular protein transport protein USO1 n=1 Tax=Ananas comosus TaxID=4615 RepID=A0A199V2T8_ANACO|nr:intracellular protein transport protein USO1 [Ananas comosus]XP_020091320.1 intracellular protein transport protein USO1 [Ananas comosus]OAY71397.1 hypothetical protein ACMD2_07803 [Ananas comosus]